MKAPILDEILDSAAEAMAEARETAADNLAYNRELFLAELEALRTPLGFAEF